MKKTISLLLLLAAIFCLSDTISAYEIGASGGYRWYDVHTFNNTKYAYVLANYDYVKDELDTPCYNAFYHWTFSSNDKAYIDDTSFSYSKLDFCNPLPTYWYYGSSTAGITYLQNSAGQWSVSDGSHTVAGFNTGTTTYSQIWFNPSSDTYNTTLKKNYLVRHEIGHTLGLGHTATTFKDSIMFRYIDTAIYQTIQSHDLTDMANFYPN